MSEVPPTCDTWPSRTLGAKPDRCLAQCPNRFPSRFPIAGPFGQSSPDARGHRLFSGKDSVICFWQRRQSTPARSYPAGSALFVCAGLLVRLKVIGMRGASAANPWCAYGNRSRLAQPVRSAAKQLVQRKGDRSSRVNYADPRRRLLAFASPSRQGLRS